MNLTRLNYLSNQSPQTRFIPVWIVSSYPILRLCSEFLRKIHIDRNLIFITKSLLINRISQLSGRRRSEEAATTNAATSSQQVLPGLSCSDTTLSQEGRAQAFLALHLPTNFLLLCYKYTAEASINFEFRSVYFFLFCLWFMDLVKEIKYYNKKYISAKLAEMVKVPNWWMKSYYKVGHTVQVYEGIKSSLYRIIEIVIYFWGIIVAQSPLFICWPLHF